MKNNYINRINQNASFGLNINKRLFHLLLFIFLISFNASFSQKNVDSLKQVWNNAKIEDAERFKAINTYYKTQTYAQPDSVLLVIDYHYKLAEKKNEKRQMANALNEKSYAYYLKGQIDMSMEAIEKAIELYKEIDDKAALSLSYGNLGNIYGEIRDYQKAVWYFNLNLKISQDLGKEKEVARMLYNLGIIYSMLDSYDLALANFNKVLSIYKNLNLVNNTGSALYSIAEVYYKQGKYEEAIHEIDKALPILSKINNKVTVSDCYFLLSKCYDKLKQPNKAIENVDKSLEMDTIFNNNSMIVEHLTLKAGLTFNTNVPLATQQANDVLKLLKEDTAHQLKADIYNLLYKCYKDKGAYDTSLLMHEKYTVYNDSVQIEKNKLSIIEEAIQKDFDEKLFDTKIENEKKQAQLKLLQFKKTAAIIGCSGLVVLFVVLYYRNHIKKNHRERELLLKELELLKSEVNGNLLMDSNKFELNREKLETSINRKLNDTDWNVLNILFENPVIPNKDIAEKVFKSVEGVSSSLRRMYDYFEIDETKYKKIGLIMDAIKRSNKSV